MTSEVKQIIYEETLRFANQTMPTDEYLRRHPNSRAKDWMKKPITIEEVDASTMCKQQHIEITGAPSGHFIMRHSHLLCLGGGLNCYSATSISMMRHKKPSF